MRGKWPWLLALIVCFAFFLAWRLAPISAQHLAMAPRPQHESSVAPSTTPSLAKPAPSITGQPSLVVTAPTPGASPALNPEEVIESVEEQVRPSAEIQPSPGPENATVENPEEEAVAAAEVVSGARTFSVPIGNSQLRVAEHVSPGSCSLVFFAPHDSEKTCVEAALDVVHRYGGRILELKSGGNRNISFKLGEHGVSADPNRIFTETGIRRTLSDGAAFDTTAKFAAKLLEVMKARPGRLLVALHNNTNGPPLEIYSYARGKSHGIEAAEYFSNPALDGDDFFLVTTRPLFEKLKQAGYNVVLQDNQRVPDDGSLSVYCGRHGIPYVNVEAQLGHRAEQTRMIEAVVMLDASKPIPPAGNRVEPRPPAPRPRLQTEEKNLPGPTPMPAPTTSPGATKVRAF